MDLSTILLTAAQDAVQRQAQPQYLPLNHEAGEYALPVPFSATQHLLLNAIVSSHYSELLAYFSDEDAPDAARTERAQLALEKMADNITSVCVHPALLIDHYMPNNMLARDTPAALARESGLFQLLAKLVYLTADMNLQIGVIAKSGVTTNLLEAFLADKPVNCYRFSGAALREHRPQRGSTSLYLVPSSLQFLSAAINTAFDLMIVVDNSFDLSSDYAHGLRSQLRDPTVRRPMAPIVSLVPLNSLVHAELSLPGNRIDALASAVVFSARAGEMPREIQHVLESDPRDLLAWLSSPDSPWPLGRINCLPPVGHRQVYEILLQTPDVEAARQQVPPHKRTKIEEGVKDNFTIKLVDQYDKLRASHAHVLEELESFRRTATGRENALDEARNEIIRLALSEKTKLDKTTTYENRIKRLKAELAEAKQHNEAMNAKLDELAAGDSEAISSKLAAAIRENEALKRENGTVKARLESQEAIAEHLKSEFFQATTTIGGLNATMEQQRTELERYKSDDAPLQPKDLVDEVLQGRITELEKEIGTLKENKGLQEHIGKSVAANKDVAIAKRGSQRIRQVEN